MADKQASRPDCFYCQGTSWNDDAIQLDADDFKGADCEFCEGTGKAMHSDNTDTTYRHRDPLMAVARYRKHGRGDAPDNGFNPYFNCKRHLHLEHRPLAHIEELAA